MIPRLLWYKPIPDFPEYKACIDGSIWSYYFDPPLKLKPKINRRGVTQVLLYSKNGTKKYSTVHRLILITFVGERPFGLETRHFPDRDPSNNHLNNIQYGTREENIADIKTHKTQPKGENHHYAKLTVVQVKELRRQYEEEDYTQRELAAIYGIHQSTLYSILIRETWRHVR